MQDEIRYFKLNVKLQSTGKVYYIRANDEREAKEIVKRFKAFQNAVGSQIESCQEVDSNEYFESKKEIDAKKNSFNNYDVTVSLPSNNASLVTIKHLYTRAPDVEKAKYHINGILRARYPAGSKVVSVKKISYEAFKKGMAEVNKQYFKVVARCGHVGERMYYLVDFYVIAASPTEAAERVKNYPRVKKSNATSGIDSVKRITKEEYENGLQEMQANPFLHHNELNEQEQLELEKMIKENRREVRFRTNKKVKQAENRQEEIEESELKTKKYKREKSKYKEDAGLYLNKKLKHLRVFGLE